MFCPRCNLEFGELQSICSNCFGKLIEKKDSSPEIKIQKKISQNQIKQEIKVSHEDLIKDRNVQQVKKAKESSLKTIKSKDYYADKFTHNSYKAGSFKTDNFTIETETQKIRKIIGAIISFIFPGFGQIFLGRKFNLIIKGIIILFIFLLSQKYHNNFFLFLIRFYSAVDAFLFIK